VALVHGLSPTVRGSESDTVFGRSPQLMFLNQVASVIASVMSDRALILRPFSQVTARPVE
jgi:hypothetical protein